MHSPIIQARKNSSVWKITAFEKRPSINKILSFFVNFDHPLSPCCSSLVLRIASKCHFFTPLPPLQRRVCLWIVPKIFAHLERDRIDGIPVGNQYMFQIHQTENLLKHCWLKRFGWMELNCHSTDQLLELHLNRRCIL